MKQPVTVLLAALAVVAAVLPASAQDQAAAAGKATQATRPGVTASQPQAAAGNASSPIQGALFLGTLSNDNTGDLTRVGAYDLLRQGTLPQLGLQLWGQRGGTRFDVTAFNGGDKRDQRYVGRLNVNRYLRAHVSYEQFQVRTQHDPLTYMDSAVGTFVVRHDDLDPTARYSNGRAVVDAAVNLTMPGFTPLQLSVSHRQETRNGHHQTMTTSHCANCHTTATTRQLAETTRDLVAAANLRLSRMALEATVSSRQFKDTSATPTILYDKAVQPQTLADAFLNRVSYDSRSGVLPYDRVARTSRDSQSLRARFDLPADAVITGSYTHSKTKNRDLGFAADYSGGMGQVVVPLGKRATLRASARRYRLDADDVFVNVGEPVAPAGPSAGLTYAQAYPSLGTVDFVRESTLSRTPTEAALEFDVRPWKRTAVRARYSFEQVNRAVSEVEKTTTNRLLVSGRSRLGKGLSVRVRADQRWTSDPFTNRTAAIPTAYQLTPSPGLQPFGGQQYFQMYDSRAADLTSLPTSHFTGEGALTWSPLERVAISAHYRARRATNDSLNYSRWQQRVDLPGAEIWVAPSERVTLTAGYGYQRERTETLFTTLAFVG